MIYQSVLRESHIFFFFRNQVIWRFEKAFYLVESFCSGKRLWILLKHRSPSKCAINAGIPQNFLPDIVSIEGAKENQVRLCEKMKVIFTGVLK